MKKLRIILYLSAGATAFFIAGAYGGYEYSTHRNVQWGWMCHAMSTETYVDVLRKLRMSNTKDALDTLENRLDLHVWLMGDRSENRSDETIASARSALLSVKRYRQEFPWSGSDPKINAAVAEALSKFDAEE